MKISNFSKPIGIAILLLIINLPIHAGQLYRYPDEDGVLTISKRLPPYAAQKGYDILDEKSLHLIERIKPALTAKQISELEQNLSEQKEANRLAEIAAKEELERNKKQYIYDQNLIARYQSDQDLIKTRDADLKYHKIQIEETTKKLSQNKKNLYQLQQQAAEQELSGKALSANLNKRLTATQNAILNNETDLERLKMEVKQLTIQYEVDLIRLKKLLSANNSSID
jgi:rRNA-processing protein FCF1